MLLGGREGAHLNCVSPTPCTPSVLSPLHRGAARACANLPGGSRGQASIGTQVQPTPRPSRAFGEHFLEQMGARG